MQFALHSATPKIEAFYQHYYDTTTAAMLSRDPEICGSWVDWYGEAVCDIDRLVSLVGPEALDPVDEKSAHS